VDLHVVNGFLGSGKTTAIINAIRWLSARGVRTGVITNDKGRHLVDTAYISGEGVPVAEVPGGCFRCNAGDFQTRIEALQRDVQPDALFAESVGSCVDLVGPVLLPLVESRDHGAMRVTYSVFVDVRLLRRRLLGLPLPFSDNISYIFDQQLAEGDLLVLNKVDLLAPDEGDEFFDLASRRFPDKTLLLQSSLTPDGVAPWLTALAEGPALPPALELDYGPYIAGAAEMAWLDEQVRFTPCDGQGQGYLRHFVELLLGSLREAGGPVAHLKLHICSAEGGGKLSFTALDDPNWHADLPATLSGPITCTINARVQMDADSLRAIVERALAEALVGAGVAYHATGATAFAPTVPR